MNPIRTALALAAGTALVVPATAGAAVDGPSSIGVAQQGTLCVTCFVDVGATRVRFAGGWNDTALPCSADRRLRVRGTVFRTALSGDSTTSFTVRRNGLRENCAEGGPNLGVAPLAARHGMACADGTWRRGRYGFVARTTHVATGLVSLVDVEWVVRRRCG